MLFESKKTWRCAGCGMENTPEMRFCEYCGSEKPAEPAKPTCPSCGVELPKGKLNFCRNCGAPLEKPEPDELPCPHCGQPNGADKKFCRHCGQPMTAPEPTEAPEPEEEIIEEPVIDEVAPEESEVEEPGIEEEVSEEPEVEETEIEAPEVDEEAIPEVEEPEAPAVEEVIPGEMVSEEPECSEIPGLCPECGAVNPPERVFCGDCGLRLIQHEKEGESLE